MSHEIYLPREVFPAGRADQVDFDCGDAERASA